MVSVSIMSIVSLAISMFTLGFVLCNLLHNTIWRR